MVCSARCGGQVGARRLAGSRSSEKEASPPTPSPSLCRVAATDGGEAKKIIIKRKKMVLKSPSPSSWAELKWTHLQHTVAHTHVHRHGAGGRREGRCSQSCSSRREWLAMLLQKCTSAPSLRKHADYWSIFLGSLPHSSPASSLSSSRPPPSHLPPLTPPPPHRLGVAGEQNLTHPPLSSPLSLRPSSPSCFPTHLPTRQLLAFAVLPPTAAARPVEGKTRGKGKVAVGIQGVGLWEGELASWLSDANGSLPSTSWPGAARFCCKLLHGRKRNECG